MFMHQRVVRRVGRPLIRYGSMFIQDQERIQNLNYIYNCNEVEALWMLRMKRAPFARLVETFMIRALLQDNINTCVEEQVAMFLHVVGHNQRSRVIHKTFRRSMETISGYFKQVFFVVGQLRGEMIKRPSDRTPPKIRGSPRWYPYFKMSIDNIHFSWLDMLVLFKLSTNTGLRCHFQDCIGAIDGIHVTTRVPRSQSAAYRGRKHYRS
ncbi:hypothetical protein ZWY2020_037672 [Hordeum vulgare]|nr:hypothetical protein ZWY2020_037672 [Hordeum vulgare]